MRVLKISFYLILSFLIVVFALLNSTSVQLNYLFGRTQLPLSLVMFIFLSLGALIGMIWTASWVISQRGSNHELKTKVDLLQKEIDNLRAMPVKDVKQWT